MPGVLGGFTPVFKESALMPDGFDQGGVAPARPETVLVIEASEIQARQIKAELRTLVGRCSPSPPLAKHSPLCPIPHLI